MLRFLDFALDGSVTGCVMNLALLLRINRNIVATAKTVVVDPRRYIMVVVFLRARLDYIRT